MPVEFMTCGRFQICPPCGYVQASTFLITYNWWANGKGIFQAWDVKWIQTLMQFWSVLIIIFQRKVQKGTTILDSPLSVLLQRHFVSSVSKHSFSLLSGSLCLWFLWKMFLMQLLCAWLGNYLPFSLEMQCMETVQYQRGITWCEYIVMHKISNTINKTLNTKQFETDPIFLY